MKYNLLGKSDISISEISFGCMSLKGDHAENTILLHHALDHGINLFDTADLYGNGSNETMLGKAFKDRRGKVIISTKVGNQTRADGSGWDWNPNKDYILKSVEGSLQRLQTDYIDLYMLHGGTLEDPMDETIEAFEILKQQGKIRQYGISSIRPAVIREYVKRSGIACVMMQYSLLDRRPEEACLDLLKEHSISVLSRGSLAKGLLVNKAAQPYLNYTEEEVSKAAEAVRALAANSRMPAEAAIRFVLHHPAISTAVVGIRTREQLEEAIKVSATTPLSAEEMEALRRSVPANVYDL